jgi:hypothetical protein
VTLYAAGAGAPTQLAQSKTDTNGAFKLNAKQAPNGSVLYVVTKGGTPKATAAKGPNDAIALLAVLGSAPPPKVVINEFTTIASVWTHNQFIDGTTIKGPALGLKIAVTYELCRSADRRLGHDHSRPLNSSQTPTMANSLRSPTLPDASLA